MSSVQDLDTPTDPPQGLDLLTAAALQDDMLTASHDLWRLRSLLTNGINRLTEQLMGVYEQVGALPVVDPQATQQLRAALSRAVVEMQFHDMAEQMIDHVQKRLDRSADLVADAMLGEGDAAIPDPLRPCPVARDDRQGGSVQLF